MSLLGNSCCICFPLWCRSSCCRASFTRSFWMLGSCQVYRSMTQRDETHYFLGSRSGCIDEWLTSSTFLGYMWCVTSNLASPMAMAQWHNWTVSRCPWCPAWSSAFWTSATSWNLVEYNSSAFASSQLGGWPQKMCQSSADYWGYHLHQPSKSSTML